MSSPAGFGSIRIHPPRLPGAAPGTVIGVVERLNSKAEVQENFPLVAERTHAISLRRGERHLLSGWSPYFDLRPTVITGGNAPSVNLAMSQPAGPTPRARGSSGWICLWEHTDGQWDLRSLPMERGELRRGPSAPPAAPDGIWAFQTGGPNRAPACTILPSSTEMTVRPLTPALAGSLEVRPVADSGYTLLEALRTGRMNAASAIERTWEQASARPNTRISLFDLAVGYFHCRRGDVERIQQWLMELPSVPVRGEGAPDILIIRAWLAQYDQSLRASRGIIDQLAEERTLPMAAEGLRILADAIRLLGRDHREPPSPWHWLERCLSSSAHTALTTYTANAPDLPSRIPRRRQRPPAEGHLRFKLKPADDGTSVTWQPMQAFRPQMVAAEAMHDEIRPSSGRATAGFTLVIRHPDANLLWQFAQRLMTHTEIRPMVFTGLHTLELRLTSRDVPEIVRQLAPFRDDARAGRMTLSVPGADLEILDSPVTQLTDLLPEIPFERF